MIGITTDGQSLAKMSEKIRQKLHSIKPLNDGDTEQINLGLSVKLLREILEWDLASPQPHRSPSALFRELCLVGYEYLKENPPNTLGRGFPSRKSPSSVEGPPNSVREAIRGILDRHSLEATEELVEAIPLALVNLLSGKGEPPKEEGDKE